jgi:hypothetical protein
MHKQSERARNMLLATAGNTPQCLDSGWSERDRLDDYVDGTVSEVCSTRNKTSMTGVWFDCLIDHGGCSRTAI